jgi:predicted protein tyrosine phosphatase
MIKGTRNQLANVSNQFQGKKKKVLTVCSAGLLRSPTTANVLHKQYGFNTRACGSCKDFALIPISEALIMWADEIIFVNADNFIDLDFDEKELMKDLEKVYAVLDIPDVYDWGDSNLESIILDQYNKRVKLNGMDI